MLFRRVDLEEVRELDDPLDPLDRPELFERLDLLEVLDPGDRFLPLDFAERDRVDLLDPLELVFLLEEEDLLVRLGISIALPSAAKPPQEGI